MATTGGDINVAERSIALLVRGSFGGGGGGGVHHRGHLLSQSHWSYLQKANIENKIRRCRK